MAEITIRVGGQDTFVVAGVFVAECLNDEGERDLRIVPCGDSSLSLQVGMLSSALDRARDQRRSSWRTVDTD